MRAMLAMQAMWVMLAVGLATLAAALGARYGLVEPGEMARACDPRSWSEGCRVRTLVIQAFIHQRVAWAGLGLAALAGVLWHFKVALRAVPLLAVLGGAAALAGLVLYSAEPAAPALLLALLVLSVSAGSAASAESPR
jgi:hypothetical protein